MTCPKIAIKCTIYVFFQVLIMVLQNKYGGRFFIKYFKYKYYGLFYNIPNDTLCCICQYEIEKGQNFVITPCNHVFHSKCLERWMEEKMECPICRGVIPEI